MGSYFALSDLVGVGALLLVGLVTALATGRSRLVVDGLVAVARGMLRGARNVGLLWTHRCLRLGLLVALTLVTSWSATIAQAGFAPTKAALGEGPARHETFYCRSMQRHMHGRVLHKLRDGQWQRDELPFWIRDSCPGEGTLVVDHEGYLSCTLHGRGPDQPPVWTGESSSRRRSVEGRP